MDGLSRAVGSGLPWTVGDVTYMLRPITLDDYGTIENILLEARKSPIQLAKESLSGLSADLQKALLADALKMEVTRKNYVSSTEIAEFIDSKPGVIYIIWLMLRREQPGMTRERVAELINKLNEDKMQKLIELRDQVSGLGAMGNSTGPAAAPANPKVETTDAGTTGDTPSGV